MKVFQTYSGAAEKYFLSQSVTPYDYTGNGGTEYDIFKDIYSKVADDEPWGALSWKFEIKTHIAVDDFIKSAEELFRSGAECVFINPMIGAEAVFRNVWEQGVLCGHTGMDKIISFLTKEGCIDGIDQMMGRDVFSFCNFFIARKSFWKKYFTYVDGVLALLADQANSGSPCGRAYAGPGFYAKNPKLSMKPFIIERLFSSFLSRGDTSFSRIELDHDIYKYKFGTLLGNTLRTLSDQKNIERNSSEDRSCYRWGQAREMILSGRSLITLMHLDDPDISLVDVGLTVG